MTSPLKQVIEEARGEGQFRCARCGYAVGEVPFDDDLSIVCPACGYEMVFKVSVKLLPRDPDYDRYVRSRLWRIERLLLIVGIGLVLLVGGFGIVAFALMGV